MSSSRNKQNGSKEKEKSKFLKSVAPMPGRRNMSVWEGIPEGILRSDNVYTCNTNPN